MRLHPIIEAELDTIPGRWKIETGSKHFHILVDGRLAAILPKGKNMKKDSDRRQSLNVRASIRRAIGDHE
jgi:hypothetical protein